MNITTKPSNSLHPVAIQLRFIAAGIFVPIFEELFIRGYIFRVAYQWEMQRRAGCKEPLAEVLDGMSIDAVAPGAWSYGAIAISTVAFVVGHHTTEWLAATAFGLLMAWLWIQRRDLLSCIVAHGTANMALAAYVWNTGEWGLW